MPRGLVALVLLLTPSAAPGEQVHVKSYTRKDGTVVRSHDRRGPHQASAPGSVPAGESDAPEPETPPAPKLAAPTPPTPPQDRASGDAGGVLVGMLCGLVVLVVLVRYSLKAVGVFGSQNRRTYRRPSGGDNPFA